jgi:hypothetical protein
MKRVTAAIAIALSAASFSHAEARDTQVAANAAPFRAYSVNRPLNYRFPVLPRNHSFVNRNHHHHHWHRRHRYFQPLPALAGPVVIYQNGEIGIPPEEEFTGAIPQVPVQPVIHRLGVSGACGLQRVNVPGSHGRTTVNIWRC